MDVLEGPEEIAALLRNADAEDGAGASARYVVGRLELIDERIRLEIERLREMAGGVGGDGHPGFYASHNHVDRLLTERAGTITPPAMSDDAAGFRAELDAEAAAVASAGGEVRLLDLAHRMELTELDVDLLLLAAAPAFDDRFEGLFAHLHDDRSRRHATVGLALRLCCVDPTVAAIRDRLGEDGPLVRGGLVTVLDAQRPFVASELRVRDRVVRHLLGSDVAEAAIAALEIEAAPIASATSRQLASIFGSGRPAAYVRDVAGVGGGSAAAGAFAQLGLGTVMLDLQGLPKEVGLAEVSGIARAATCEANLRGAGLVVSPVEVLAERGLAFVQSFADVSVPLALVGRTPWDPAWSRRAVVTVSADRIDSGERLRLWEDALGNTAHAVSAASWTSSFRLTPQQILRAGASAQQHAEAEGRALSREDVHRGVRAQNASGLQRLAQRIEPRVSWDDIVLDPRIEAQLRELPMRWRHRDRVLDDWGMGRGVATGRGVSALFAGGSGTGKTLAAEVIAGDLGLDLYLVDLSTVVDKYIGETSKNLERIFDQADRVNGVLLFDEADALFGKRSAVSDAKDRHANVEVAFLLQRMETFDGVAILTTNLAANLDEAFLRRLDTIVDFASPTVEQRRAIWTAKLGRGIPCAGDVDVELLAEVFTMSGAEIANAVVSAAYHAAEREGEVTMADLVEATVREHRKLGRHLADADLAAVLPD